MCCPYDCNDKLKVGDKVKTNRKHVEWFCNAVSFHGVVRRVKERSGSNDLITVCVNGGTKHIDTTFLELDLECCQFKPLCKPSIIERALGRRCCCHC